MVLRYNCAKFGALAQRVTIIPLSDCTTTLYHPDSTKKHCMAVYWKYD